MVNTELANYVPPLDTNTANLEQYEQAVTSAKEKYFAVAFLHLDYNPMSLDLNNNNEHPRIHNDNGARRYITGSERVTVHVWMSAINMMMGDTRRMSSTSSDDSNPSHTDTSTPSSDLPEHVVGNSTTQDDNIDTTRERSG